MGAAEGDEGGDVEAANPDDIDLGQVGGEAKPPVVIVIEGGFRLDAGQAYHRHHLGEDAPLGQGQDQFFVGTQHRSVSGRR